jgi:hypothetical protein
LPSIFIAVSDFLFLRISPAEMRANEFAKNNLAISAYTCVCMYLRTSIVTQLVGALREPRTTHKKRGARQIENKLEENERRPSA